MESFVKAFKDTLKSPEDGIVSLRTEAFEEFSKIGVPNSRHEYWKFSDPSVILNLDLKLNVFGYGFGFHFIWIWTFVLMFSYIINILKSKFKSTFT